MPGNRRKQIIMLVALAPAIYVAAAAVLYFAQDGMIFPGAYRSPPATAGPRDPDVEQVWITSDDGFRVEAWFQLGEGRMPESPGPALMYFHGNDVTVDSAWWIAAHSGQCGISTMVVEYRGYGRAEGRPSQQAIVGDSIRFFDWLAERPEVDRERMILQGTSLGGAVAAAVAEERRPAALILECSFTSLEKMAHRYLMPGFLCRYPFHTDRILPTLDIPIAIFHGRRDPLIPFAHAQRLHELAPNSRLVALDCGHDDFHNDWENIRAFLADVNLLPD